MADVGRLATLCALATWLALVHGEPELARALRLEELASSELGDAGTSALRPAAARAARWQSDDALRRTGATSCSGSLDALAVDRGVHRTLRSRSALAASSARQRAGESLRRSLQWRLRERAPRAIGRARRTELGAASDERRARARSRGASARHASSASQDERRELARRGGGVRARVHRLTRRGAAPRPPRVDRAPRARGRAAPHLRRGRPRPRDHRDHRSRRQVGRAGAPLREPEGLEAPAPHQPVRHRAAHVPGVRRREARRRRRQARRHPRHAAAAGARREGARPPQAEVGRGLHAEDRLEGAVPGGRSPGRRRRPRRGCRSSAAGRAIPRRSSRSRRSSRRTRRRASATSACTGCR